MRTTTSWTWTSTLVAVVTTALCMGTAPPAFARDDRNYGLHIDKAEYSAGKDKLTISGEAFNNAAVSLFDAESNALMATLTADDDGEWKYKERHLSAIPCVVRAESAGQTDQRDVRHADQFAGGCGIAGGGGGGGGTPTGPTQPKHTFNLLMNYELGMHCTGFEFSYCCVLPPYNSIVAQLVKTEKNDKFPTLLGGDPNVGIDPLGRETVVRDGFNKYVMRYWHDAQPRNDGRGAPQSSTLIAMAEGNSLLMWNTKFDAAAPDAGNNLVYGAYNGASGVLQGDGSYAGANDNYANAWYNHFFIYVDPATPTAAGPNLEGHGATGLEADKIRLGVQVVYPENTGAALQPLGPGVVGAGFENVLTWSGETGTMVYTQSKTVENLPVMLTSPRIWEALGLALTPFEDTINFFGDPGAVDEGSVRPYVRMRAQLFDYATGNAVLDNGQPVIGTGNAPIDIPNCERCHALGDGDSVNSAQNGRPVLAALVQDELDFWNAYEGVDTAAGDSDWYSRLKAAAISMLAIHDEEHGTSFTANFPGVVLNPDGSLSDTSDIPQNTRLGHEVVLCHRCHADNVIADVKSAYAPDGDLIPALTEALHRNHQNNPFMDSNNRNGGCQGCHPAHRSDGDLTGYPITELGLNAQAGGDNRDAAGGCFVGRDVHSNRNRNADATTPNHMNAVGQWLVDNVVSDSGTDKGIWCTNCHTQLSQEMWKADNWSDPVNNIGTTVRNAPTLADVAAGLGISEAQAIAWLDPKTNADTAAIWAADPGLCDHVATLFGAPATWQQDGMVATIEVNLSTDPTQCVSGLGVPGPDCNGDGSPDFIICDTADGDGDLSVNILDFCTTGDCVAAAQATLTGPGQAAVPVPFSAATDGRDHWLSPGEPHCADCHASPYVEQSGGQNPFPPFNYPKKPALFRYTRGHQDITCQGCHESIHGLYPTTAIDTTSQAQAADLNADGSLGPLKCGACHDANDFGVMDWTDKLTYNGQPVKADFDAAVSWMHTYTNEANPTASVCTNCHSDKTSEVSPTQEEWLEHAMKGRVSRAAMDKVEIALLGSVSGATNPLTTVCLGCHNDNSSRVTCSSTKWKSHLTEGRVSASVWEAVANAVAGDTCGY